VRWGLKEAKPERNVLYHFGKGCEKAMPFGQSQATAHLTEISLEMPQADDDVQFRKLIS